MKTTVLASMLLCAVDLSAAYSNYEKIDCHSHFMPPGYKSALIDNGQSHPDGQPGIPTWSVDDHLALMDSINITKSILSISTPGTHLVPGNDALAHNVTTYVNDFAANLKKTMPDHFGFWASLPLPDVNGSIAEINRAFDELNADGVAVLTNHHGIYLGDPRFDPVFDELNKRSAHVFIHPTTPYMYRNNSDPVIAAPLPQYPRSMFEFFFDSARAVINLFLTGTVERCPNITFQIAHMGGALPPMIRRFAEVPSLLGLKTAAVSPELVDELFMKQFYFDAAGWPYPEQIEGLLEHVTADRLLYGSDYCFTNAHAVQELSAEEDKYLPLIFPNELDREKLCKLNAMKLLEMGHT